MLIRLSEKQTRSRLHALNWVAFANQRHRLRQTDVKAGHYERKVQALEAERDNWETKHEEMSKKYDALRAELQELEASMGNI